MQRHFSNRGEALAEVTAARTSAGRKRSAQAEFTTQGRRSKVQQWFSQPVETTTPAKRKQPIQDANITPLL
jgi:hypothetical protein